MPEIAELSAGEKSAVQEHSESLTSPETPAAAFREFASRVIGAQKAEAKEKPEPKDAKPVDLSKLTHEQLQHWNKTSEIPKSEKTESSEPEVKGDAKASTAKEDFIDVREGIDEGVRKLAERAWTEQLQGKDRDDYKAHTEKQVKAWTDYLDKHERRHEVESGLRNMGTMFSGLRPEEAEARLRDFSFALAELRNPGAVLAELGLDQVARNILMMARNRQELRQVVFGLAGELTKKARSAKAAKAAEVRPRAPKPPTEVGGRGAPAERADIAAARAGNFKAFDQEMRARYSRTR
jgi:hypothetical protein